MWTPDRPVQRSPRQTHRQDQVFEDLQGASCPQSSPIFLNTNIVDAHIYFCHQNSSTYWEGRSDMETLQRIYGISFPDSKMLKEWERVQEEAKNRDHRKIGKVSQREVL